MDRIVTETARAYGATAELQYDFMVPPTINDDDSAEIARQAVKEVLGESALTHMRKQQAERILLFDLEKNQDVLFSRDIYNEDPVLMRLIPITVIISIWMILFYQELPACMRSMP